MDTTDGGGSLSYSLDLIAIEGGSTIASGLNSTSSASPYDCVAPAFVFDDLFSSAKKVAFGIIDKERK